MYFYPENMLNPFSNKILTLAMVKYNSPIIESFGLYGGSLVTIAGVIFEIIFLSIVLFSIKRLQKRRLQNRKTMLYLLGVTLGIMMIITSSWLTDVAMVLNALFNNYYITIILILAFVIVTAFFCLYTFWSISIPFFKELFPRRSKT